MFLIFITIGRHSPLQVSSTDYDPIQIGNGCLGSNERL